MSTIPFLYNFVFSLDLKLFSFASFLICLITIQPLTLQQLSKFSLKILPENTSIEFSFLAIFHL